MLKIIATIRKEAMILLKDRPGMLILFLMPVVLIIIMALIQDAPFKAFQNLKVDVLVVDNDGGKLAKNITLGLSEISQFNLVETFNKEPLTTAKAQELVRSGKYKIAVIIPERATAAIVSSANKLVNDLMAKSELQINLPVKKNTDSTQIILSFDPAIQPSLKSAIRQSLEALIIRTESDMVMKRMLGSLKTYGVIDNDSMSFQLNTVGIREEAGGDGVSIPDVATNSVQHNVPAWSIFAMLFIALPVASNSIQERTNGSMLRMMLTPGFYGGIIIGKLLFYICVSIIQFYLMILVGMYILPLFDLPALALGHHYLATFIIAVNIGLLATSYGLLLGSIFSTPNQVLNLGIGSIVVLSAIGGIWVPLEIMPAALQSIGKYSPPHWGLDAFNNIYLRNIGLEAVWPHACKLFFTSCVILILTIFNEKRKTN